MLNWKEDGAVFEGRKQKAKSVSQSLNPMIRYQNDLRNRFISAGSIPAGSIPVENFLCESLGCSFSKLNILSIYLHALSKTFIFFVRALGTKYSLGMLSASIEPVSMIL